MVIMNDLELYELFENLRKVMQQKRKQSFKTQQSIQYSAVHQDHHLKLICFQNKSQILFCPGL